VRASGGAFEITVGGVRFLRSITLYCEAPICDGVLRRWGALAAYNTEPHPFDVKLEEPTANSKGKYYLQCPKCASRNLLGRDAPTTLSNYRISEVVGPR
jgi:hypothetical protein